jgi:hypothetical protein
LDSTEGFGLAGQSGREGRGESRAATKGVRFRSAARSTDQTLKIRVITIQVHLSGMNKKRDHGPIMVKG